MTTFQLFTTAWDWHPSVVAGCIGLFAVYVVAARPLSPRRTLWYAVGVLTILFALVSPIDPLGDDYLFSAHMIQHLLLALVAPPLLLLGTPPSLARRLLVRPWIAWLERRLSRPAVAWLLGIGTLWIWHLPFLDNAALANERIHIAEHLSFMVTGTIFFWPVLSPLQECRLQPGTSLLYLFGAGVANTALGILLTFIPAGLYPAYLHPDDELGALALIRNTWGLSPAADQQLGGLFMWVGGGLVFLIVILAVMYRWYASPAQNAEGAKRLPKELPGRPSANRIPTQPTRGD